MATPTSSSSSISATLDRLMEHIPGPLAQQMAPVVKDIPPDLPTRVMETGAQVLIALGLVVLGWVLARWARERTYRGMLRAHLNETAANFFSSVMRFTVLLVFLGGAVVQLGGSAQMLLAIAGGLVVALGLGMKDTVAHVIGGIMLLINRPLEVGDYVQVGSLQGTVKRVNLFQTEINTLDNVRLFMPNKMIWESTVQNYTHNRIRMVEVKVGVDHRHSFAEVKAALLSVAEGDERILRDPAPFVGIDVITEISPVYMMRTWIRTTDWVEVRFGLLGLVKNELERRGLGLARHPLLSHTLLEVSNAGKPRGAIRPRTPTKRQTAGHTVKAKTKTRAKTKKRN